MESYASQKTSSLEAENKRLNAEIERMGEQLKAADEVINLAVKAINDDLPLSDVLDALEKYESLKTKK